MTPPATSSPSGRWGRLLVALSVAAAGLASASCGDDIFRVDWEISPDTVVLHSLARPELNLASGFDFYNGFSLVVEEPESTGNWDMAVDTRNGRLVALPPGALGVTSKARVAPLRGVTFEEVTEAPADSALYVATQAVPMELGTIYVWRTRQTFGSFGRVCVYYAKMEPLVLDPVAGKLTFVFDSSPVCNDRSLIPPK